MYGNAPRHNAPKRPGKPAAPTASAATSTPERSPSDFLPKNYPVVAFPDEDWQWLVQRCEALELPDPTPRRGVFQALYSHLLGVNHWLNLTRLTTPKDYLKFSLLDSLTIVPILESLCQENSALADLGSGGGYPGLPVMTMMTTQDFTLIDARQKKVEFLNASIPLIPRSGKGAACAFRGRDVMRVRPDLHHHAEVVTARAVGKGVELLPDASELLAVGGVFLLMKGQSWPAEEAPLFTEACPAFGFDVVEDQELSLEPADPTRHIILAVKKGPINPRKAKKYLP